MKPIYFPDYTDVIAKNQPEYIGLPAHVNREDDAGTVTSCWQLTLRERLVLLFTGKIWHQCLTFRGPLQPLKLSVANPLLEGD